MLDTYKSEPELFGTINNGYNVMIDWWYYKVLKLPKGIYDYKSAINDYISLNYGEKDKDWKLINIRCMGHGRVSIDEYHINILSSENSNSKPKVIEKKVLFFDVTPFV